LRLLGEARKYALRNQTDFWQFALELPLLRGEEITATVLRGLVVRGLALHGHETIRPGARRRTVHQSVAGFNKHSCFILTEPGAALAAQLDVQDAAALVDGTVSSDDPRRQAAIRPAFVTCPDGRRQLLVLGCLVREYSFPAMNQEIVLNSFEEQQWAQRIVNPFVGHGAQNAKKRQHNTLDRLNRNQVNPLLRFHGDGTGLGITWELLRLPKENPTTT
jgi:hypothetical protein